MRKFYLIGPIVVEVLLERCRQAGCTGVEEPMPPPRSEKEIQKEKEDLEKKKSERKRRKK